MIPVYRPSLTQLEEGKLMQAFRSGWISSKGQLVDDFEAEFSTYTGSSAATTVSNGTVALHLALSCLGLGVGDEVVVPAFTYVATVNTILQTGAKPVFVDSDPHSGQMCVEQVKAAITDKTRCIMAVHLYGQPCDIVALADVARTFGLLLVEDCAEALGTSVGGQHVGTFGDIGTFSFFGNKTITTGEGGMVVSQHNDLIDKARHLKNQGVSSSKEYWHDCMAFNYRMTNLQAAIGMAQLERLNEILSKKREIHAFYCAAFQNLPMRLLTEREGEISSYWMCSVVLDDRRQREGLRAFMSERGIETRPFFPLVTDFPYISSACAFPDAQQISMSGFNLPSFPDLNQVELAAIVECVSDFF